MVIKRCAVVEVARFMTSLTCVRLHLVLDELQLHFKKQSLFICVLTFQHSEEMWQYIYYFRNLDDPLLFIVLQSNLPTYLPKYLLQYIEKKDIFLKDSLQVDNLNPLWSSFNFSKIKLILALWQATKKADCGRTQDSYW